MNVVCKYKWIISNDLLNTLKKTEFGIPFESPTFGEYHNLIFMIFPNGDEKKDKGSVIAGFRLIRMPTNLNIIWVDYELKLVTDKDTTKFQELADVDHDRSWVWPENTYLNKSLLSCKEITIYLTMKIIKVIDNNDQEIPYQTWESYGIIQNNEPNHFVTHN